MSLEDRVVGAIIDPHSLPNRIARWIIVLSVLILAILVIAKWLGGTL